MLPPPTPDQAYIDVSALEAGIISLPIEKIVADTKPERALVPSLAFSLRHSKTGFQMVFDLGTCREFERYPPAAQRRIRDFGFSPTVDQNVAESLEKGGVLPEQVDAVIVSHLHWDHIGDHTPFTKAMFIVGEGCRGLLANGYPQYPDALFSSSAIPVDRARFISESEMNMSIGPYPNALDFFGDGSLYIVDAPGKFQRRSLLEACGLLMWQYTAGHVAGHINVLARTSPSGSWILLGGDSAHDWRIVTGEKSFACVFDAVTGAEKCIMHANKEVAEKNVSWIRELLKLGSVQVLLAHDRLWYEANKGGLAFLPGLIPPVVVVS